MGFFSNVWAILEEVTGVFVGTAMAEEAEITTEVVWEYPNVKRSSSPLLIQVLDPGVLTDQILV